ncbi:hypothetical protein AMK59_4071 [Oryctes borbonicus]|uniref:Uncharacterized protein n=1 Tax=Oryctes borbonicus TaxID=1629725 RepID=A0A0T6B4U9_9SCAR|nr:hypothetical protein AMK59_4071 [Oryctes borbonicus]
MRSDHLSKHIKTHQKQRITRDTVEIEQEEEQQWKIEFSENKSNYSRWINQSIKYDNVQRNFSQLAATSTQSASSDSSSNEEKMIITINGSEADELIISDPLDN